MSTSKKRFNVGQFVLTFALIYLGSQIVLRMIFPDQFGTQTTLTGVQLRAQDNTVKGDHHPVLLLTNHDDTDLVLEDRCPMPPVDVYQVGDGNELTPLTVDSTVLPCKPLEVVPAGETVKIDLGPWKYSMFSDYATYEVELPVASGSVAATDTDSQYREGIIARFEVYEPGPVTKLFRTIVTKPLLNALIFIASLTPDKNLGIAIIVLTILVKLLLFFPTQHAMEGQKKMQKVQPQLDALREKYKSNPERLNKEIMELWKREGVNPMQSCLPILIQFPVLIGLFFVIRDGSVIALSEHLLYEPYQNLSWTFGTQFLGFDLLEPSWYVFPPLLVVLQFLQMKLSFAIAKRKQAKGDTKKKAAPNAQETQQRLMTYGLPIMIGVFAFQFPAAVSLYWAISTVFAIGQQIVVNRKEP